MINILGAHQIRLNPFYVTQGTQIFFQSLPLPLSFFHSLIVPYLYKMSIVEPWPNFSPAQTPGQTHFQFSLNTSKALILSCTIPVSVKYGYVWFSICDLLAYSWSIYASLKAKNAAYCLLPKAPENTFESRSALMVQDVSSITLY